MSQTVIRTKHLLQLVDADYPVTFSVIESGHVNCFLVIEEDPQGEELRVMNTDQVLELAIKFDESITEADLPTSAKVSPDRTIDRQASNDLRDRWALSRRHLPKHLPLVVGEECYEFFGEWVKIVEVNLFDEVHNAEVVIESRSMERKQVTFSELSWRRNHRLMDAMSEKPEIDVILEGVS